MPCYAGILKPGLHPEHTIAMPRSAYQDKIQPILRSLPDKPGVYQYFDDTGKLIYVGKAKSLRKRVASYFNKDVSANAKLQVMVRRIADIRFIEVASEFDALLLENNLIKKHQPRYNILLKDDKTFPWIVIRKEDFPRIHSTRNIVRDGSEYFGPYGSVRMMKTLLELIRDLYPLRTCSLRLSQDNILKKKFKVCLEYHLGNCKGPCEGKQSAEEYASTVSHIRSIIRGNITEVMVELRNLMMQYAGEMAFEKAQQVKEKITLLERYQSKSAVVNPRISNVDVFSLAGDASFTCVNYLKVMNGSIVQGHTVEVKRKLDEPPEEVLSLAIMDIRERFHSNANEVIVPFKPDTQIPGLEYTVPQKGDKKTLLDLSLRNAISYKIEKEKQRALVDPDMRSKRILEIMQKDLQLRQLPAHIECFDNSNIQGSYPVAAMVVFRDARPSKKEYRHFNIKTVQGPDDFASMEEVVYRRYSRMLKEGATLPQLIIIDGGKGQLHAAMNSLSQLKILDQVHIIGIAKRLEELYRPGDPLPLHLDKTSETLRVIQRLRDEAHRFGITHHRKRREKGSLKTALTDIPGIGPARADALLLAFRSYRKVVAATEQQLSEIIGPAAGADLYRHLHPESTPPE